MRRLTLLLIVGSALCTLGLGEWREVARRDPATVEFKTYLTETFVGTTGGAAVRWHLVPTRVLCGNRYEVKVRATGWAPGVQGNSLPISGLQLEIHCTPGAQRQTATTDREGYATFTFIAPREPEVQNLALTRPHPNYYVADPLTVTSFRYLLSWDYHRPVTRRGRAEYLDPVTVNAHLIADAVADNGNRYQTSADFPNEHLKALRLTAEPSVRFEWEGQRKDRTIDVTASRYGYFDFAVRGRYPRRELIRVEPVPVRPGIVFVAPLADPTWAEFIGADMATACIFGYLLRPVRTGTAAPAAPDDSGNYLIELGSVPAGTLINPARSLPVEAYIPLLDDTAARSVSGRYAVTRGRLLLANTVNPVTGEDGIFRTSGKLPELNLVMDPGENLIEVTSPNAENKVTYRIIGLTAVEATGVAGQDLTLTATASPNPVHLPQTERSTITGAFDLGSYTGDTQASLRVRVSRANLIVPPAARNGDPQGRGSVGGAREGNEPTDIRINRDGDYTADLKPNADGTFTFVIRRSEPGTARVNIYVWSGRHNRTLKEVTLDVVFTTRPEPSVYIDRDGGVGVDLGGVRIGIPGRTRTRDEPAPESAPQEEEH